MCAARRRKPADARSANGKPLIDATAKSRLVIGVRTNDLKTSRLSHLQISPPSSPVSSPPSSSSTSRSFELSLPESEPEPLRLGEAVTGAEPAERRAGRPCPSRATEPAPTPRRRAATPPRCATPTRTGVRWPARRGATAGIHHAPPAAPPADTSGSIACDRYTTVETLKEKVRLYCGDPSTTDVELTLQDSSGRTIATLSDDAKMIGFYSPADGWSVQYLMSSDDAEPAKPRWPARRGATAGMAVSEAEHTARIAAGIVSQRPPLSVHKGGRSEVRIRWPARRGATAGLSAAQ